MHSEDPGAERETTKHQIQVYYNNLINIDTMSIDKWWGKARIID